MRQPFAAECTSPSPIVVQYGGNKNTGASSYWRNRLCEVGLILSMLCYYVVGNPNLPSGFLASLNPLFALPFLLLFALFAWYRLPFAIALLPLSLPYYLYQKNIVGNIRFSLTEITLATCVIIAVLQLLFLQNERRSWLAWSAWRARLGPFIVPILLFMTAAAVSITVAYSQTNALRALREEVCDPLLYLGLVLLYLRTREDLNRLIFALLGTGLSVALLGAIQYFFFKNTLVLEDGVRRVHAVYGSANSIGLLFNYILPIAFAWLLGRVCWKNRALALALCLPMLLVLFLTQSLGAWVAIAVATLFVLVCSMRQRKFLLIGSGVLLVLLAVFIVAFHTQILHYVTLRHSGNGVSTVTKRIYLWQSALQMIHDSPWLGYGMDNWLCHYSRNTVCFSTIHHYWIINAPTTGLPTGLHDEPNLSHPHDIFLHVWVSMGIFGLLALIAVLGLFYWLFARILRHLHTATVEQSAQLRWMTVGIAAAMLAALGQGLVDSAFLEQDLSFCFWILIAALLLLRTLSGTSWRGEKA
ncbi:MAG: O-antigen ligase family protein [Chloroflexi bacterium]|nr:MAG: O-antigen ligase family protein [Chloroflexota bacterium]